MKKSIKYLFCLLVLIMFNSCSIESDDTKLDPSGIEEISLEALLPGLQAQATWNQGGTAGRLAGAISQQIENASGCGATQSWWSSRTHLNNYWITALYTGCLINAKRMIEMAEEEDNTFYSGVGKLLMAHQYGIATSIFGDIPFSQALQGENNLNPIYDRQQDVYTGVQELLDSAIEDLNNSSGNYRGGDLIYNGDKALWIKTAHALKARFYMHLIKRDPANIMKAKAALALSYNSDQETSYFMFEGNEDSYYSFAAFNEERPRNMIMHPEFLPRMLDDPRLEKYFWLDNFTYSMTDNPDLVWSGIREIKVPLISYCEVKFLEAEILTNEGSDASEVLAEAIRVNMTMNGVNSELAESYIEQQADLSTLSQGKRLNRVMLEAHKAYFGYNFFEAWTNYRRTGYPTLNEDYVTPTEFNPSGVIPLRSLYTDQEMEYNAENVLDAESRQGGGWLDDPLWAFE